MASENKIIRPAGLLEQYHITRCFLDFDSCLVNAAQYIPRNGQGLDQARLYRALRRVIKSHTALGVRLVGDSLSKTSFERLEKISLPEVVQFSGSHDLQAIIEEQFMRPLPLTSPTLPLWRLVVLGDNTVCFAWHHGIGDGISGVAFHRALLAALRETEHGEIATSDVVIPSENDMVPAIETIVNLTPSWRKIFLELYNLFAPVAWTRGASAWTGGSLSTDASLQTRVRIFEYSPDDASAFLALCRSHKATLTSAFQILAIAVLSSLITTDSLDTISSYVPISLRNLTGTTDDVFCDHVSAMHTYPRLNSNFSWDEASRYASDIKSYAAKSVEEIGMLRFLFGNYVSFNRGKLGKKRDGGIEISNVGRFVATGVEDEVSTWAIGRMIFAQCDAVAGSALKMNVVGDPVGGINITVTWGVGVIPDSLGDEFVSRFRYGVNEILTKVDISI